MSKHLNNLNKPWLYFVLIVLAELLSYVSLGSGAYMGVAFGFVLMIFLVVAVFNMKAALIITAVELLISSKGYLFFITLGDKVLSIRIAFWAVIMAVWFITAGLGVARYLIQKNNQKEIVDNYFRFFKSRYFLAISLLLLAVIWGVVNGFFSQNNLNFLFNDFNAWLYLLIVFPIYDNFKNKNDLKPLFQISLLAAVWLSIKGLFVLYMYAHFSGESLLGLYKWVRDSGVGEITYNSDGFYRIFFQSQIYALAIYIVLLFKFVFFESIGVRSLLYNNRILLIGASALFVGIVISQSRSNWLGLGAGMLISIGLIGIKRKLPGIKRFLGFLLLTSVVASLFIAIAINIPLPRQSVDVSAVSALTKRVSNKEEGAVSSRWALLPILLKHNMEAPIMGKGFGAELTYQSSDPRQLNSVNRGEYTTYAFEWGWLDIWLKLGLLGVSAFGYLFVIVFKDFLAFYRSECYWLITGLAVVLAVLATVNMFSPYLNHPLGLGFLAWMIVVFDIHRYPKLS